MRPKTIVRAILTALLLFGIYTETGIWTTLSMTLNVIGFEALAYHLKRTGAL